jgi:hypothetical protein
LRFDDGTVQHDQANKTHGEYHMSYKPIATGVVKSLCINGLRVPTITFDLDGPRGEKHSGYTRKLSGHDGPYIATSALNKGDVIFNWRTWTALSFEEVCAVESSLGVNIPQGCLLENLTVSGISDISRLAPTSRLVFPYRKAEDGAGQAILAVWSKNNPCKTVGDRLELHHQRPGLSNSFRLAAKGKRGIEGFVLSFGVVAVGDVVLVYPPTS